MRYRDISAQTVKDIQTYFNILSERYRERHLQLEGAEELLHLPHAVATHCTPVQLAQVHQEGGEVGEGDELGGVAVVEFPYLWACAKGGGGGGVGEWVSGVVDE